MEPEPFNDPDIDWPYPLFTRRLVGAVGTVVFDFDWKARFGRNAASFSGLKDLSSAVSGFASGEDMKSILLLTDKASVPFDEQQLNGKYIAIVDFNDFVSKVGETDRAAFFFLAHFSRLRVGSTGANASALPLRVAQLTSYLELSLQNSGSVLIEALEAGGVDLTVSLLKAAILVVRGGVAVPAVTQLMELFASDSSAFVAEAAVAAQRRAAVEKFRQMLVADKTEHEFQPWFKEQPWVLGSDCAQILEARKIDVQNISDYLIEAYDGYADVVELKRPRLQFWAEQKDHDNYVPHADLVAAIVQSQNYQFELEREMNSIKTRDRLKGVPIAKPSSLLIYGRSKDWDDERFQAQRLLNAGFTCLKIMTYDQVLHRAEVILGRSGALLGAEDTAQAV